MKGPCSRIDLMKQHAGIDVQAMYPAGAPPKADQWTYDTFLKAAKEDHSRAADDVEEVHRGGDSERAGYASGEQQRGRDVASYIYQDENGAPYLCVTRTSAKQFPQTRWQDGRWVWGKPAGPKIPYRLPELVAAAPTTPVFICEGEKDADSVAALGFNATTNSEGAGKWTTELNKWFAGKQTVYILEDNDDAGPSHAAKVASALHGIVPEIRVVSFPELPNHGDVSDWLETGGTKAQLLERAKKAKPPDKGYTMVRASDIVPREMDWLWPGHLLRGSLELLTGLPGMGKSQVHCQFVASVTTGEAWPNVPASRDHRRRLPFANAFISAVTVGASTAPVIRIRPPVANSISITPALSATGATDAASGSGVIATAGDVGVR